MTALSCRNGEEMLERYDHDAYHGLDTLPAQVGAVDEDVRADVATFSTTVELPNTLIAWIKAHSLKQRKPDGPGSDSTRYRFRMSGMLEKQVQALHAPARARPVPKDISSSHRIP